MYLESADFNSDGSSDLAVSNGGSDSISILLNKGDGTFGSGTEAAVGALPHDVKAGDLDLDGAIDLVVAINQQQEVDVLLGKGDGTFEPAVSYPVGLPGPHDVAIGLYDADNIPDLAVANYAEGWWPGTVSILLGNGDGTFGPAQDFPAGTNPVGLNQGDFNNDGEIDLAVPDNNGSMGVSVLLGNGDGTFQAPGWYSTVGYNPRGPAVGDFNEDGNLDVGVGTYQWPSGVSVLLGNVDGTFSGPTNYNVPDNLGNLVATDMDKDGHIDLVTANMSGSLSILLGNGDGTFNPARNVAAGQSPVDVAVADLDNDGVLEIAAADYGGNAAVVLKSGIECVPKASFS
jgi:hypothetical protein